MNNKYIDLTSEEIRKVKEDLLSSNSKAVNTLTSYKKDFKDFEYYCENKNINPYGKDYEVITDYLTYLSLKKLKISTIKRRLSSISYMYEQKGIEFKRNHTKIRDVMIVLKKELGESIDRVDPLEPDDLDVILDVIDKEIAKDQKN